MQKSKKKNILITNKNKNFIFLDYASSTPIDFSVLSVMNKSFKEDFANPGSINEASLLTKNKLTKAREDISKIINCRKEEVVFTSGSTESNNLAILGVLFVYKKNKIPHFITTEIEHPSVLEVFKFLEKNKKIEVSFVKVDKNGLVCPQDIKKEIKENTVLVSVMYANNEIGTIQPIREIAKEIRHWNKNNKNKVLFHTDATQAINYLSINIEKLGVDMMSFNAHKIYGPKGVGVLFKKREIDFGKIMYGGSQEFDFRPGTENLPLVLGLAKALEITEKIKQKESERLVSLRDFFIKELKNKIPNLLINGDLEKRLPNNINITIPNLPSDLLVVEFSASGVFISEKSACKSGEKGGSYVIKAISQTTEDVPSLRFSLGRFTTKKDILYTIKVFSNILKKLSLWYK